MTSKLVMNDREKQYFQKLPLALRQRIAALLNQPELITPDGRSMRKLERLKDAQFIITRPTRSPTGVRTVTAPTSLERAAEHTVATLDELKEFFNRPRSKFKHLNIFTEEAELGTITIRRAE